LKHVLFVAFHYPPEASSSGVLRTLKYTRYLLEHGWRATVIAPSESAYDVVDEKLKDQIPKEVRVIRTRFLNTKRHLSIRGIYPALCAVPDTWIGWMPWAVSAGKALFQSDPYDLVYSTSPHATSHLIARKLAAFSHKPWVTDFRDPWYEDPPEPGAPNGVMYRWANKTLERKVIRASSRVVASTTELRDLLQERYPVEPKEKFLAILNGYDEADFTDIPVGEQRGDRLVMLHAGSINADFRDPRPLFAALRKAADSGAIDLKKICVRFIGPGKYAESDEIRGEVKRLRLEGSIEFLPRVSYDKSLLELSRANLLLLLQASPDTASLVPAKLYEYLRTYRPVLALVCPGATADIVKTTHGGWAVAPEDVPTLQAAIKEIYSLWLCDKLDEVRAEPGVLQQFDRRILTGKLADVFKELS
jgi:glycosyltransferase involved in cell wall biosynthesis